MIAFLLSRTGLTVIAVTLVLGVIGVQTLRLQHAKADLVSARADLKTAKASLTASEGFRTSEDQQARKALSDAEKACASRVAGAVKAGSAIRAIVSRPVRVDPVTHCAIREMVGADDLRKVVEP